MNIKKGIRALGIAESFNKNKEKGVIVGIVERADRILDGFSYTYTTIGGLDATDSILEIYRDLDREDINYILVSGVVISWYNVIDLSRIYWETGIPLISITYEESEGLTKYFIRNFPEDWHERLLVYFKNGEREKIKLHNNMEIYIRYLGIDRETANKILNLFTYEGKYPEPIRIARLIAYKLAKRLTSQNTV
jgi:hypothetical protein